MLFLVKKGYDLPIYNNSLCLNNIINLQLPIVNVTKLLGVMIDNSLCLKNHIDLVCNKLNSKLFILLKNSYIFTYKFKIIIFKLFLLPHIDYCSIFICSNLKKLEKLYNKSLDFFLHIKLDFLNVNMKIKVQQQHNLYLLHHRLFLHYCSFIINIFKNNKATSILGLFNTKNTNEITYNLRCKLSLPVFSTNVKQFSFLYISTKLINAFIFNKIFINNYSKKYLYDNFISLFDKYYA